MEYIEGETLSSILKRGVLPLMQTLQLGREIAEGLANAHARGLVHRDVKPSNVMVTTHGHVKLLDFGVAGSTSRARPRDETRTLSPQVTVHAGTPQYMAPEQAAGQPITTRAICSRLASSCTNASPPAAVLGIDDVRLTCGT
jgi:serine/threonine protein kinase